VANNAAIAVFFAVFDTVMTLSHATWWPTHPGTAAWIMLWVQAAVCLSLFFWQRAPFVVLGIMGGFTLVITLLISPAGVITPENADNVWAPFATAVAAYGPIFCNRNRRTAFIVIGVVTVIVARPWQPSLVVITVGVARTLVGPLLALYFGARRALLQALRDRAERAEREQHLLAEQAREEERRRLAGEMHDVVTHRVSLMVLQAGGRGTAGRWLPGPG
jgi:signal transduction histidine kinase